MTGRINTREDLDRTVVGPALTLPVAEMVTGVDFDFDDPFHVLDSIKSGHQQAERETMLLRQLFAIHQKGEHHVVLHGAREWNAVVVAVNTAEYHIARGVLVRASILE